MAASDLAAMGARPLGMTVALTLPAADELWLHAFSQGIAAAVAGTSCRWSAVIPPAAPDDHGAGIGRLPMGRPCCAAGAGRGWRLRVGQPGGCRRRPGRAGRRVVAAAGPGRIPAGPIQSPARPDGAGIASCWGLASAAIDISDGLLADAGHIAAASGAGCASSRPAALSPALRVPPRRSRPGSGRWPAAMITSCVLPAPELNRRRVAPESAAVEPGSGWTAAR